MNLRCKFCHSEHNADSESFPLVLYDQQEAFIGRGRNRKSQGIKKVIVGYVCRKCASKHHRGEFIKQHSIKPLFGQRISDAIKKKIEELKLKPKPPLISKEPKAELSQEKSWRRFFKRKERTIDERKKL